jgi:hypothetical protein
VAGISPRAGFHFYRVGSGLGREIHRAPSFLRPTPSATEKPGLRFTACLVAVSCPPSPGSLPVQLFRRRQDASDVQLKNEISIKIALKNLSSHRTDSSITKNAEHAGIPLAAGVKSGREHRFRTCPFPRVAGA